MDQLVPKLSGACYAIRSMLHISNTYTLRSVYFAYFHSIMKYGIIFWGNSSDSKKAFTLQKKTVRLMMRVKCCNYYRDLFKRLEILTLPCEYIFFLINFVTNNEEHFPTNGDVHSVNTRHKHYLHKSTANFSDFQKSAPYARLKIFNNLPSDLKSLMNGKAQFTITLKRYLNTHYTLLMNTYCLKNESSI
jgi:hypothetical protein